MTAPPPSLLRLLRFLGKVQFTTLLLVGGAAIMTVGTILESRGSREIAWSAIYGTAWFDLFLFLIAVNLVIAVVNRIPIRRHQWPFVVTHFAIVILLAGAWISQTFGYEGRLMVYEGEEESRLFMDASEIRVRWLGGAHMPAGGEVAFPVPRSGGIAGRTLQEAGSGAPGIRIADYLPDGTVRSELRQGETSAPPGVEFLLAAGQQHVRTWLLADDPRLSRRDLGPVEVEFRRAPAGAPLEVPSRLAKPRIAILLSPDHELRVETIAASGPSAPVPATVGRTVPLPALGLELRLERLLASARPEFEVTPSPEGSESGRAWVRLEAGVNGTRKSLWLERGGVARSLILDEGGRLEASFGPRVRTLPFAIALEEFELIHHPGSSRPAEYRSRVRVKPAGPGLPPRDEVISMNRPLDVAGFRLFQSSYKLGEAGEPDATILTVSRDPGVPIVYASFALLISGIAWGLIGVRRKPEPLAGTPARPGSAPGAGRALGLLLAALACLAPASEGWAQSASGGGARLPVEETRGWAILDEGRTKPLLTYANETALAVTGRERFDGLNALEMLWGYVLSPREFKDRPYIRIDSLELKAALGLDESQKRFSFISLMSRRPLQELTARALQRRRAEQELSRLEKDALEAYAKLDRIGGLLSGASLTIVPTPDALGAWMPPSTLEGTRDPAQVAIHQGFERLSAAYAGGDAEGFAREARALSIALRNAHPAVYPTEAELARELFYEDFNAFGKAWKLYLVGFLAILLLGFSDRPWGYAAGLALVFGGFVCHSIGLGTRWVIADRAPVSDMYESLVFMGWGAIALGLAAEVFNRKRFLALSAGLMGFVCLAFAENLPIDSAINPLVPVLAHTYWLAVHVMTVMLSYSAFALAMVLGHAMLFVEVFRREKTALLSSLSRLLYRTLQVGVLFLASGVVFGAIWANESWGRYWGWDPKETWSLITFFVYLAIIHARFAGWLHHFGLAATAILGFLAVVMTYYGVNFILATGMHAYGFSEGGQLYVGLYAVLEIAIVAGARLRYAAAYKLSPTPVATPDATKA